MSQARRHTNEHIKDFIDIGVHIEQSTRHDHTHYKVSCQVIPRGGRLRVHTVSPLELYAMQ